MKNKITTLKPPYELMVGLALLVISFAASIAINFIAVHSRLIEKKRADELEQQVLQLKSQRSKCETSFLYCEDTMEDLANGWKEVNSRCISSLEDTIKMLEKR